MVENWGIGSPDFSISPSRTELGTNQTVWQGSISFAIPPVTPTYSEPVYTVPAGKRLILGAICVSFSLSGIVSSALAKNGTYFFPIYASQFFSVPLSDTGGFVFEAGDVLTYVVDNYFLAVLGVSCDFSGFLYSV